jgi:hypothetical protein
MSKVNNIPGDKNTIVVLSYQDYHEGWHCNGELEESAVSETFTARSIATVITDKELKATTSWGEDLAIGVLREQDMLESYERGEEMFEDFVTDTIKENFWELDALIECNIEQYDHKRGRCTVSSELKTTLGNLKKAPHSVSGWTASVDFNGGTFSVDL